MINDRDSFDVKNTSASQETERFVYALPLNSVLEHVGDVCDFGSRAILFWFHEC